MRALNFGDVVFLAKGALWTLALFFVSLVGGSVIGIALALMRTSPWRPLRWFALGYFRLIQGTPVLMQIFLIYFGTALLGFEFGALLSAGLALSINAGAFLGEIWASSIDSVGKGQSEAARVLGLRYGTTMWHIVIPQAMRVATPPTVGFLVQLVKGTAMASFVGFVELTRASQMINNATFQPFVIFGGVSLLYFAICWPLSLLSSRLEARLAKAYTR
ncbi:MAG: amino acid ABC transporter permease [Rhizobiaceae bacterium]|nr:amino acid ABC transporter permease [Rhizobiaceae bacterium]